MDEVNGRAHRVTRRPPVEMLAEEQARLHRLPEAAFTAAFGETRKVSWSSTISFGGVTYSVPHTLVDAEVWVRVDGDEIVATHVAAAGAVEVARHLRSTPGTPRIDDAHYPPRPAGPLNRQPKPTNAAEAEFLALGDGARMWLRRSGRRRHGTGQGEDGRRRRSWPACTASSGSTGRSVTPPPTAASPTATSRRSSPPTPPANTAAPTTTTRCRPAPAPGTASERRHDRRHRHTRPTRSSSCCASCACRTCAATPPTCWPPPKRNAGNPPKPSGPCSPRSSPAARPPRSTPAARPPGSPPARPSTPGTRPCQSIPAPTQRSLATLEWIDRHENLVVCGPSGTGKTHLLEALGHAAIGHGCHVQWFTLEALGALVHRHRADDTTSRAIRKIMRADLICIDDIGLLPGQHRHRRSPLPRRRRRLRETLHRPVLQPSPRRVRRADAQDHRQRHRRPAHAPRPRRHHHRRLHPPHPSHPRQGGEATGQLTRAELAGRQRAVLVATSGQIY